MLTSLFSDPNDLHSTRRQRIDGLFTAARAGHISNTLWLLTYFKQDEQLKNLPTLDEEECFYCLYATYPIKTYDDLFAAVLSETASHGQCMLLKYLLALDEANVSASKYCSTKLFNRTLLEIAAHGGKADTVQCILNYLVEIRKSREEEK